MDILLLLNNALGHPPIHGRLSSQCQSSASATEYYTTLLIQPMDQGVTATFKKYHLRHTFRQAVKPSDESGTTLAIWEGL